MVHINNYSASTTDVIIDTTRTARSIGTLTPNNSRLTVKASLAANNDAVDNFGFKLAADSKNIGIVFKATSPSKTITTGYTTLSSTAVTNDVGDGRVRIIDQKGNVLADSNGGATAAQKKNYQALRSGTLSLGKGIYYIQVTRTPGVQANKVVNYAVEVTADTGTYTNNYTTTEYQPSPTAAANAAPATGGTLAANNASNLLNGAGSSSTASADILTALNSSSTTTGTIADLFA